MNEESLDFGPLVGQTNQSEDIVMGNNYKAELRAAAESGYHSADHIPSISCKRIYLLLI